MESLRLDLGFASWVHAVTMQRDAIRAPMHLIQRRRIRRCIVIELSAVAGGGQLPIDGTHDLLLKNMVSTAKIAKDVRAGRIRTFDGQRPRSGRRRPTVPGASLRCSRATRRSIGRASTVGEDALR